MTAFFATLEPMLIMFLFLAVGFALIRLGMIHENSASVLSRLENYIFVPCLIFSTFIKYCTVDSLGEYGTFIIYSCGVPALSVVIALTLSPLFEKRGYNRNIYKYALAFGNFSFMGNAIAPMILGEGRLAGYMIFCLPLNLVVYTWGIIILMPKKDNRIDPVKMLFNPIIISIVAGVIVGLCREPLLYRIRSINPALLSNGFVNSVIGAVGGAIGLAGACMGPCAMLLTGMAIGKYRIKSLLSDKRIYISSVLRLIVFPAVFAGILKYIVRVDEAIIGYVLIAYATPLGLNTVVFPSAYGADASVGASMAMVSHTLSVITLPIMCMIFGV